VPVGSYRLPGGGRDGVLVSRDGVLTRALWIGDEEVVVRAWPVAGAVRIRAEGPPGDADGSRDTHASRDAAAVAIERMRFALGTDHDLREFQRRFRRDPLIGPVIRRWPWLRPRRRPEPFEALAWAVCEQLIDSGRAAAIQRSIVRRHGRRSACGALRAPPSAAWLAGRSPAELDACGLAPKRSIALVRAAREVASGRADLSQHEPAWRRLRAIPNIGDWTLEMLAVEGQGRDDQLPALDVAYLKLVGLAARLGRRATEAEVRAFFAPYGEYAALAGCYALQRRH
jgi:3-methyladenine DNA glycosylase/8-oxoguanine DNA glycosylase